MIAVGDVQLEIVLCLTLRGTVRELAAFMKALTSSELVVGFGQADGDGKKREEINGLCNSAPIPESASGESHTQGPHARRSNGGRRDLCSPAGLLRCLA